MPTPLDGLQQRTLWHAARLAGTIASILIVGCHDSFTSPNGPRIGPGISPRFVLDTVGNRNVVESATYDQSVEPHYGGGDPKDAWTFGFATIYEVQVAGDVHQVADFSGFGNNSTWGPLGNPATGDPMYNAKVGLIAGSTQWYPKALTDTVRLNGTWNAFRGPAAPQPMGDANHCGIPGFAPCWHWTGAAHLALRRLPASLVLTADKTGPVDPGTAVTFTQSAAPASIAGMPVDVSPNTRRWVSDFPGTGDTVTCSSASGPVCVRTMVNSGTLYLGAYVNGKEDEKWQRVEVIGRSHLPPPHCRDAVTISMPETDDDDYAPGGDSVNVKYSSLASAAAESLFAQIWQHSNYTPDAVTLRRERDGYVIKTADGGYRYEEVTAAVVTPCGTRDPSFPNLAPGETALWSVHSHPAAAGDNLLTMCGFPTRIPTYQPNSDVRDNMSVITERIQLNQPDLGGIFIDADGITLFWPDTDPIHILKQDVRITRCGY
jgi:hypothetical protein